MDTNKIKNIYVKKYIWEVKVMKDILRTFIVFVQDIQAIFRFNILGLDNFELTYWRRQELNLLQKVQNTRVNKGQLCAWCVKLPTTSTMGD